MRVYASAGVRPARPPCAPYTARMDLPLVICVGNLARGDDGAAHRVAELLADAPARVLAAPQLTVEMAEDVAAAAMAVFVDAERRASPPVLVAEVAPSHVTPASAHALDPGGLVALVEALFGPAPRALLVTVAAPEMGHREGLSGTAEAASVEAASAIRALLDEA